MCLMLGYTSAMTQVSVQDVIRQAPNITRIVKNLAVVCSISLRLLCVENYNDYGG